MAGKGNYGANLGKEYKKYDGQKETHSGLALTIKESKFISNYIELGDKKQAAIAAGYNEKTALKSANRLLQQQKIRDEVAYLLEQLDTDKIASADEILGYFTGVMRGEIKDQFGLDASLSERTSAAKELAKRIIDMPNQAKDNKEPAEVRLVIERRKDD